MDAGGQRYAETDRAELHRDGAVQLERPDRACKGATRTKFNRAADWLQEPVEHAARCQHSYCSIDVGEAVVRGDCVLAFCRIGADERADGVGGRAGRLRCQSRWTLTEHEAGVARGDRWYRISEGHSVAGSSDREWSFVYSLAAI